MPYPESPSPYRSTSSNKPLRSTGTDKFCTIPTWCYLAFDMPQIIDLFAGAGGLSLGAARAGFDVAAAVELDPFAMETHSKNFRYAKHLPIDVSMLTGKELLKMSGLAPGQLTGLIGGPPCQGFSDMGRREVSDSRNDLFGHFFRLVAETRPSFFVAENVPGIMHSRYDSIRNTAFAWLPKDYQILEPIVVKANHYGAPTTRTRVFFIGYRDGQFSTQLNATDFAPPQDVELATVSKTLQGLPPRIDSRWLTEELGWRKALPCGGSYLADRITNVVPPRIGDPASLARYFERGEVSGCMGTRHSEELKRRYGRLKYGETDPVSKSRRLDPNGFCPTLRAGTGKEKGSYQAVRPIHFSSPRVITPREAARLQGFPDWFVFHKTKWHSFRQIGNSVSPIVAERILTPLYQSLHQAI